MKRLTLFASFAACSLASFAASAQDPASSGTTDVAQEGFQAATVPVAGDDATELSLSAGGLFTSGNANSLALTAAGQFRLRRGDNQLGIAAAANLAKAAADSDADLETTVENYQGLLRYDRFFSERLTGFLSVSARHDTFQALDLRLNISPGLAYYFVTEEKIRFWGELGYDLQHDIRTQEALDAAEDAMEELDETATRHNVRAYLGYSNVMNDYLTVATGLEYLQSVNETEFWRLNWDLALTSKISDAFSIATTFALKYDSSPLPDVKNTDTVTAINLVYTF